MKAGGKQEGRKQGERGDTPLIAVILLFGFVFAGAAVVAFTGMMAMDAIEDRSVGERNLQAMQQFDADISSLQYAGEDERVPLEFEGGDTEIANHGRLTFTINGECSYEQDLNALVHEDGGNELHYQAGGIFKPGDGGSELVSSPNFDYRQNTVGGEIIWMMDFPLVSLEESENASVGDTKTASFDEERTSEEQQRMMEELCLADGDTIVRNVTITLADNPHQDAWKRYFEDVESAHPDADIVIEDGETELRVTAPLGPEEVDLRPENVPLPPDVVLPHYGSFVTAADELRLQNIDRVDGYDSEEGPYSESGEKFGNIVVLDGDLDAQVDDFTSHVRVDGDIHLQNTVLNGNADYNGLLTSQGNSEVIGNEDDRWEPLDDPPEPITDYVEYQIQLIEEYNDNDDASAIENDTVETQEAELHNGVYYLDSLDLEGGERLDINVTDGDVVVAVDGDMDAEGAIEVIDDGSGENQARWYVGGEKIELDNTDWSVKETERSVQNWVLGTSSTDTVFTHSDFTGVLFTPEASVDVENHVTIKGGLVGEVAAEPEAAAHNYIHYDRALDHYSSGDPDLIESDNGSIGIGDGSVTSVDWEVTLVDSDFASTDTSGTNFDVDLPVEEVTDHGSDLDELEYWQTASTVADEPNHGGGYYEEVTFDATYHDNVELTVESDRPDLVVEVVNPHGSVTEFDNPEDGDIEVEGGISQTGEYTIRIISDEAADEFPYDLTLKRTHVSDANVFMQGGMETGILLKDDEGDVSSKWPWPETDLAEHSTEEPAWETDIAHPAAADNYPKTITLEDQSPNVSLSTQVNYRTTVCRGYDEWGNLIDHQDSYAGTYRTHEGETYFEMGCSDGGGYDMPETINVFDDEGSDRIQILEHGDQVPDVGPVDTQKRLIDMLDGDNIDGHDRLVEEDGEYFIDLENEFERVIVFELANDAFEDCEEGDDKFHDCGVDSGDDLPTFNDMVILVEADPEFEEVIEEPGQGGETYAPEDPGLNDYGYAIQIDGGVITIESDG